ncbi:tRNA guanosine(34) transglycosylase Tgt [Candidatus Nomurabacteria bacterium]|nr:tRNA guanosine(34) transglycosylase Tgt [Candidatus Nomurabacteria bacterium]
MFKFEIQKKLEGNLGRAGVITTPHGEILTPAFVTVATKASTKALTPEQTQDCGVQVVLANTYHLYLQPGDELIRDAGGFAKFMNWQGPTMTDSGGFQVFSLGVAYGKEISKVVSITDPNFLIPERSIGSDAPLAKIGNDGVSFKSHLDGSLHYITPEKSIEIQHNLGADIIFAFDECTSPTESDRYQSEALDRTHAWAKRSLDKHKALEKEKMGESWDSQNFVRVGAPEERVKRRNFANPDSMPLPQALFGIVQGGRSEELRKKSASVIGAMDFDGYGIGGSFAKEDMQTAVKWVNEILPEEKPRHLLGIGEPEDLFMGVENGVDLFDCVGPTRIARNGTVFTKNGKINLLNAKFVNLFEPIEKDCICYTCSGERSDIKGARGPTSGYSCAYLSHLFRAKEMEAATLATIHNLYFITKLVSDMRQSIIDDTFQEFKETFLKSYIK